MDWALVPSFKTGVNDSSSNRSVHSTETGLTSLKSSNSERKKKDKRSIRSVNHASSDRSVRSTKTGSTSLKSSNSERKKKDDRSVRSTSHVTGSTSHNRANAVRRVHSRYHKTIGPVQAVLSLPIPQGKGRNVMTTFLNSTLCTVKHSLLS